MKLEFQHLIAVASLGACLIAQPGRAQEAPDHVTAKSRHRIPPSLDRARRFPVAVMTCPQAARLSPILPLASGWRELGGSAPLQDGERLVEIGDQILPVFDAD